jgi:hypothetical protein
MKCKCCNNRVRIESCGQEIYVTATRPVETDEQMAYAHRLLTRDYAIETGVTMTIAEARQFAADLIAKCDKVQSADADPNFFARMIANASNGELGPIDRGDVDRCNWE